MSAMASCAASFGLSPSDLARRTVAGARGANGRVAKLSYRGKDIGPRADGKNIVFAVVHISVTFAEDLLDA